MCRNGSKVQGLLYFNVIRLNIEYIVALFKNCNVVTHKHPINSSTQETRCGPGVKIDFLWVQEGDGMLQPHLVAVTVFVHSGLPAQPSGFRVRFGKTTSERAEESCRHDSATEGKQQIKLSRVFQRSPGTNRLSQQRSCRICRNYYKCVVISNVRLSRPLRSVILSASACCHPPLAIIQTHTNPRSFQGFLFLLTPNQAFVSLNLG